MKSKVEEVSRKYITMYIYCTDSGFNFKFITMLQTFYIFFGAKSHCQIFILKIFVVLIDHKLL